MPNHARLSPSGSTKWINCPGSVRLESTVEEVGDLSYASEGTAAHFFASECINQGFWQIPDEWIQGRSAVVVDGIAYWFGTQPEDGRVDGYYKPTGEMREGVNAYLEKLYEFVGDDSAIFAEQRLDISPITGEVGAEGTSDIVAVRGTELQIHDLKYGMKQVDAEGNTQLLIYAAAAYDAFAPLYDIESILVVIHQPRIDSYPSHSYSVETLKGFVEYIQAKAATAREALDVAESDLDRFLVPGDHCRKGYCKARASCPALADFSTKVSDSPIPTELDKLAELARLTPIIKDWCEQVELRVSTEVLAGNKVPGFKAVLGREGNRKWVDEDKVEALLKGMKIPVDTIYAKKLNSPTTLEKEAKAGKIGPKQWPKVQEFIVREPAKPTAVPETDKRPAIEVKPSVDDFDIVY